MVAKLGLKNQSSQDLMGVCVRERETDRQGEHASLLIKLLLGLSLKKNRMRWSSSDLVVSVLNCPLSKVILFVSAHTSGHTSALFSKRAEEGSPFTPTFNGAC